MSEIFNDHKSEIERMLREEFGNRLDIGISILSTTENKLTSSSILFPYDETIAVAALVEQQYEPVFAAALVYHNVVYAAPHFAGRSPEAPEFTDPVGQLLAGIYRMPDGALWSIHADNDVRWMKPEELSRDFVIFATRGSNITDEDPADRVRHLLTRCDEAGQLLEAA